MRVLPTKRVLIETRWALLPGAWATLGCHAAKAAGHSFRAARANGVGYGGGHPTITPLI